VFADRRTVGTGAGTFSISSLRYRKDELVSRHAHGFVPQTMADLGLAGLLAALALVAAWLVAAGRATGLYPRIRRLWPDPPRRDWHPERIAVVALALVPLVFGFQSAIDWTWFVPGPAVMALAAAGFVAGRGPLPNLGARPALATAAGSRSFRVGRRELPVPERPRLLAAGVVLVAAVLVAWAVWQPERSDRASSRALELVEAGQTDRALDEAREASDANPLSPRPLLVEATALAAAGRREQAEQVLEQAVLAFPGDPQTWIRLTAFELHTLDRPSTSLSVLRGALYLDPHSKSARGLYLEARARQRQRQARR
jgi:tetratricopeptide (TPR) repeat protein